MMLLYCREIEAVEVEKEREGEKEEWIAAERKGEGKFDEAEHSGLELRRN